MPNHRTLQDAGIYRNGETLLLEIKGNISSASFGGPLPKSSCPSISSLRNQSNADICVSSSTLDLCPKSLQRLVQQSRRGLAVGIKPALAPDGSGGSYFLSDARKIRVGVFKPADEEPFAENNPRGYVPHNSSSTSGEDGEWLRQGIRPGELCLREVAAFLLDHDGFSSVPMTTLAEARHPALHTAGAHWTLSEGGAGVGVHSLSSPVPTYLTGSSGTSPSAVLSHQDLVKKVGSFQEYIHAECTMDDISPSKISVDEVHKIAILDIRIMNADRNVANIMCQRVPEDPDTFRLIPIDHGYSLRTKCDVAWFDWCWLDWPQTKQPLSKASRDYVLGLDIEADVRLMQERLNMQDDVLDYFRSSCQVLKAGVRAGLTLYEVASEILCRNDPGGEVPSKLEVLTSMATELALSAVHNGRFHHATASSALEEKLSINRQPSSMFPTALKTRPVRSASSSFFSRVASLDDASAFTDDLSRIGSGVSAEFNESQSSKNNSQCPPGTAHTSQSDDSSEGDEDTGSFAFDGPDDNAAGEWAAALVAVADQSMEKDTMFDGRNRSVSESSSDESLSSALSKSPVGFWYVRPGSAMNDSYEDDEPSCTSPSTQSSMHSNPAEFSSSLPRILSQSGFSTSNLGKLLAESSPSKFNSSQESLLPTEDVLTDRLGPITTSFDMPSTPLKTMSRSMSYSAFSTHKSAAHSYNHLKSNLSRTILNNVRNISSSTHEHDLFRAYFVKFVDLLVVRETERVLHSKALKV